MSKEEKSKEYALLKLEENGYRNFHGIESVECAYSVGYTQSEQDLSSQLTAYKEALRELVELAPVVIDPCVAETYYEALECRRKYIEVSRRAKTLIE